MSAIHLLLNLAGLLLLFSWRGAAVTGAPGGALTLVSTVKSAGTNRRDVVLSLAALAALLVLRAVLYWHLGRQSDWTAYWAPGPFNISFRSDLLSRMLIFSVVSFAWVAWNCLCWLVLLAALAPVGPEPEPVAAMIRAQLGRVARMSPILAMLGIGLITSVVWCGISLALSEVGILPASNSTQYRFEQGLVITGSLMVGCKWPLSVLFGLRWIDSYLYLGTNPIWGFVQGAAGAALRPVRWATIGRLDLAPVLGIVVVWLAAIGGGRALAFLNAALPWHQR